MNNPVFTVTSAPYIDAGDQLFCSSCDKEFMDSFLYTKFDEHICDICK